MRRENKKLVSIDEIAEPSEPRHRCKTSIDAVIPRSTCREVKQSDY